MSSSDLHPVPNGTLNTLRVCTFVTLWLSGRSSLHCALRVQIWVMGQYGHMGKFFDTHTPHLCSLSRFSQHGDRRPVSQYMGKQTCTIYLQK